MLTGRISILPLTTTGRSLIAWRPRTADILSIYIVTCLKQITNLSGAS